MSSPSEHLVERLQQGSTEALAEVLEIYRARLLAYIERNLPRALRRKVAPQDVLQEVSLHALRALPAAAPQLRDPFGWLCQMAQQRIIDAHRRFAGTQKRAAHREMPLDAKVGPGSQAELIDLLVASITSPSKAFSR